MTSISQSDGWLDRPAATSLPEDLVQEHARLTLHLLGFDPRVGAYDRASDRVAASTPAAEAGVVGVGIGRVAPTLLRSFAHLLLRGEDVRGPFDENRFALLVYITSRLARQEVPARAGRYPVTTILTGEIVAAQAPPAAAPAAALGGLSVSHAAGSTGTIGCVAIDDLTQKLCILGNNHVLARINSCSAGDLILHPGLDDGGTPSTDRLGSLERWQPLLFGAGQLNEVDAALACLDDDRLARYDPAAIHQIGAVTGAVDIEQLSGAGIGLRVQKTGRTTGHTRGVVESIRTALSPVRYRDGARASFVNQIVVAPPGPWLLRLLRLWTRHPFALRGDSGALVLDEYRRAVGLVFAAARPGRAFVNPIGSVMRALSITLPVPQWQP
jgi:hypothetical protein